MCAESSVSPQKGLGGAGSGSEEEKGEERRAASELRILLREKTTEAVGRVWPVGAGVSQGGSVPPPSPSSSIIIDLYPLLPPPLFRPLLFSLPLALLILLSLPPPASYLPSKHFLFTIFRLNGIHR